MEAFDYREGTYPVQSLYYSCLNYLRINYNLINFTMLNGEIAPDMISMIKNQDHLKKFKLIPYRFIINGASLESYIYKYYKLIGGHTKYMMEYITGNHTRALLAEKKYSEYNSGILTISDGLLYDSSNDKCYHIPLGMDKYLNVIREEDVEKLYPEYMQLITKYDDKLSDIISEEYFNQYPGLADWAESNGYISRKLWLPENLIKTC